MKSHRTDYDAVAKTYDEGPFRAKEPDAELAAFARGKRALRVLDIACGTGNQLVANLAFPEIARAVGLDASRGMLEVARGKSRAVHWVQGSGDALPFADGSFDFVSHQYALHHVPDKPGLVREAFRVLAPGGRFVLTNIQPRGMTDAPVFRYFPPALEKDLRDFPATGEMERWLRDAGFAGAKAEERRTGGVRALEAIAAELSRKDSCSELTQLTPEEYAAGLARLDADFARGVRELPAPACLVTLRGDRPGR